jgi:hypothetical protein
MPPPREVAMADHPENLQLPLGLQNAPVQGSLTHPVGADCCPLYSPVRLSWGLPDGQRVSIGAAQTSCF